jgi:hypothetical protein
MNYDTDDGELFVVAIVMILILTASSSAEAYITIIVTLLTS